MTNARTDARTEDKPAQRDPLHALGIHPVCGRRPPTPKMNENKVLSAAGMVDGAGWGARPPLPCLMSINFIRQMWSLPFPCNGKVQNVSPTGIGKGTLQT